MSDPNAETEISQSEISHSEIVNPLDRRDDAGPDEEVDPNAPTPPPAEDTLAVVLAAGAGSRFISQDHKLATKLRGKPLLWWATRHALDAGFAEVVVIEGAVPVSAFVPNEASVVRNDDWEDGQARTLHVAVQYAQMCGYDAVVIGLGDQPFAPPEAWRLVAASESPIAVARFDGADGQTPPVRLHRDVWSLLPIDGDEGARQLLRSRPELVTAITCPGSAVDVDTLTELEQARRLHFTKELGKWT